MFGFAVIEYLLYFDLQYLEPIQNRGKFKVKKKRKHCVYPIPIPYIRFSVNFKDSFFIQSKVGCVRV